MSHKIKLIQDNKDIVILSGNKDSSIVIMNEKDYNRKIDDMINEGIQQGKYKETDDNILIELESFQSFLYRHFKNSPHYRQMLPSSHEPACFFATAKTHKFENMNNISTDNLKLPTIIDPTEKCYYKTGKVIAEYLKPLTNNEFVITNNQQFPSMLINVPLSKDEEDGSYDVESLFLQIFPSKKQYKKMVLLGTYIALRTLAQTLNRK